MLSRHPEFGECPRIWHMQLVAWSMQPMLICPTTLIHTCSVLSCHTHTHSILRCNIYLVQATQVHVLHVLACNSLQVVIEAAVLIRGEGRSKQLKGRQPTLGGIPLQGRHALCESSLQMDWPAAVYMLFGVHYGKNMHGVLSSQRLKADTTFPRAPC